MRKRPSNRFLRDADDERDRLSFGPRHDFSAPSRSGALSLRLQIHEAVVTLPEGLTINPDAADGQSACTDAQANFGSEGPAACPDTAKIGTIGVHSTALDGTLEGSIYIGQPKPGDQYRAVHDRRRLRAARQVRRLLPARSGDRPGHRLFRATCPRCRSTSSTYISSRPIEAWSRLRLTAASTRPKPGSFPGTTSCRT